MQNAQLQMWRMYIIYIITNLQIIYNLLKNYTKYQVNQGHRSPHILIDKIHKAKFIHPLVALISLDSCNIISMKDKSCLKLCIPH